MKIPSSKTFYFIVGFIGGLFIPITATALEYFFSDQNSVFTELIKIHKETPSIWLADITPFILGFFSAYFGGRINTISNLEKESEVRYKQMLQLRELAEKSNHAKSEFLANMSHEIRTPMNAILGLIYLLKKTQLSFKQIDYADKVQSAAKNLLRIIDDILDFSKIEAGKLTIENTNIRLEDILSEVTDIVNVKLQKKENLELVVYLDPKIPRYIMGDSVRLRQVLLNLTDNAVKFTASGEIKISIRLLSLMSYGVILQFSVKDSGIGISESQIQKLFSPFQQADDSITRKFGGTGLGLAICKNIVEMMDGELEVNSVPGEGTEFLFNAFFSNAEDSVEYGRIIENVQGKRAMLVDDSEAARMVLNEMLQSLGFEVLIASNAEEALKIYKKEKEQNNSFSLMVIDWQMPGMDGLELVKELKSLTGKDTPAVLMVTAFGKEVVREAGKNGEVEGLLIKPITMSALYDSIAQILHIPGSVIGLNNVKQASQLTEFKKQLAGLNVLLVEDIEVNMQIATELLMDVGIIVETAENGQIALDKVEEKNYDLVLMDIQMPIMDGLTASKRIRENPNKSTLPIVAMTAHALKTEFDKSIAAGMNDHITKPIDPIKLYQSILKNVLGKNLELTKQESTETPNGILILGIDTVDGMNRVLNKKALYEKLLNTFASNYNESAIQINSLLEANNQQELERYFHSLAGVAGNVGAKDLYSKAYQLSIDIKNDFYSVNQSTYIEIAELTTALIQNINEYLEKVRGNNFEESSEEIDMQSSLIKLKELITQNDVEAESIADAITNSNQISDSDREVYLKIRKLLGVFEFDEALKLLTESKEVSA